MKKVAQDRGISKRDVYNAPDLTNETEKLHKIIKIA